MINIVLCGGPGKRLWPLSAGGTPKQFIQIGGGESLYIKTIKRNQPLCDRTVVITDQKYSETADGQIIKEKIDAEIILEPSVKGTAASVMIACLMYPDETFLVTPADHEISDAHSYNDAVKRAQALAEEGHIVTFGIEPEKPENRFGYIETEGEDVKKFHEKPDDDQVLWYIGKGYLVNSGIVCFKAEVMLQELKKFLPDQLEIAKEVIENVRSGRVTHRLCGRFMGEMRFENLEYAVLEKSDKLKCVKGIRGWRDIGTYDSMFDFYADAPEGNISFNIGETFGVTDFIDSKGCMVINRDKDILVCGLDDVVVVESGGKILVAKKDTDIKEALKKIDQ